MNEQLLTRGVIALERIATALEQFALPSGETTPVGCEHPEEQRLSLSSMGEPEEWVCGVKTCRFHFKATELVGA